MSNDNEGLNQRFGKIIFKNNKSSQNSSKQENKKNIIKLIFKHQIKNVFKTNISLKKVLKK